LLFLIIIIAILVKKSRINFDFLTFYFYLAKTLGKERLEAFSLHNVGAIIYYMIMVSIFIYSENGSVCNGI